MRCLLFVVCFMVSVVCWQLCMVKRLLFAGCCRLFDVCCLLIAGCRLVVVVRFGCLLCVVCLVLMYAAVCGGLLMRSVV